ncbi:ribonuclease P protein component [Marinilactibacillus piezotolerans]|uniref:ribonuclease P protein component n=1 Tax=Marinilactibacillus piezotolerans TaxID=258723 RepID=UPI0009B0030D|nr:ribonuclease P protein component [Marinilactibacillus piezotolerans]
MKKAYRVKKEAEFQKVFRQGESVANRQFVVYVLEKPEQAHFRVGLSVGKKIGNAPTRNAVKRKIRQALTELDQEQAVKQDRDFLVIARKPTADLSFHELKKNLIHVLKIAKMI